MKSICFFDTKPYDRTFFELYKDDFDFEITYFEEKLSRKTAVLASGYDAAVAFVNDDLGKETIDALEKYGIGTVAMRCAGFNNVDLNAAKGRVRFFRVPEYSVWSVAEHAMAMLLTLNRKIHKAYLRTRDFNFSLNGLTGFDLHGKTVGIIGTGKIGRAMISLCNGFGMKVLAYDPYPAEGVSAEYVTLETLLKSSDIVSLHCPLTKETRHIINADTLNIMKDGAYVINTSRGALIESEALLQAIMQRKLGGACLDVYEEETDIFYEDFSNSIVKDDTLARLISMPNVIVTSHQAFLTTDALSSIAKITLSNLADCFAGKATENEILAKN